MTHNTDTRFNAAKLLQTDIGAWKECDHQPCIAKKTCMGGPRGTCARTGGWPICTSEGQSRLVENRARAPWVRDAAYDSETPANRALRRQEERLAQLREDAMRAEIDALVANIRAED